MAWSAWPRLHSQSSSSISLSWVIHCHLAGLDEAHALCWSTPSHLRNPSFCIEIDPSVSQDLCHFCWPGTPWQSTWRLYYHRKGGNARCLRKNWHRDSFSPYLEMPIALILCLWSLTRPIDSPLWEITQRLWWPKTSSFLLLNTAKTLWLTICNLRNRLYGCWFWGFVDEPSYSFRFCTWILGF